MADIVISEFMHQSAVDDLARDFDVIYDPTLYQRLDELYALGKDARAIVVRNLTEIRGPLFEAFPNLKAVGRNGVGLDNIDVPECRKRGIAVLPAVGANEISVAELAMGGLLTLIRGRAYFASAQVVNGEWPQSQLVGQELYGKTLGILGFGRIGRLVARRASAFDMRVVAYDPGIPADSPIWQETGVASLSFEELCRQADAISLHLPLLDSTRNLLSAEVISGLKPGVILINVARGGIVDEAAVANALREGRMGGALLDVFATEPLTADNPFHGVPNLIATPHLGATTKEARIRTGDMTAAGVRSILKDNVIPAHAII